MAISEQSNPKRDYSFNTRLHNFCGTLGRSSLETHEIDQKAVKTFCVQQSEGKKFRRWDAQRFSDTVDIFERYISFPSLHLPNVGKMQAHLGSEGFLRQPAPISHLFQLLAKLDKNIFVCHYPEQYKQ